MSDSAKPTVVERGPDPDRRMDSGIQVWEMVKEMDDRRDFFMAYTIIPPGASEGPHTQDTDEYLFYISGRAEVVLADTGEVIEIAPRNLIHIPAGIAHSHRNTGAEPLEQVFVRSALGSRP